VYTRPAFRLRPLVRALSLGASVLALPLSAQALTISTTYSFSDTQSITDTQSAGATTGTLSGSTAINQFDASNGVLMGTTLSLSSTRTQTLSGSGTDGTSKGSNKTTGTVSKSSSSITAPGVSSSFGLASRTGSCSSSGVGSDCTYAPSPANTATSASLTVSGASLNAYVGGGTVLA
jgi:hypothetical protein